MVDEKVNRISLKTQHNAQRTTQHNVKIKAWSMRSFKLSQWEDKIIPVFCLLFFIFVEMII